MYIIETWMERGFSLVFLSFLAQAAKAEACDSPVTKLKQKLFICSLFSFKFMTMAILCMEPS